MAKKDKVTQEAPVETVVDAVVDTVEVTTPEVQAPRVYNLGDKVVYNGYEDGVITAISQVQEDGGLVNRYTVTYNVSKLRQYVDQSELTPVVESTPVEEVSEEKAVEEEVKE